MNACPSKKELGDRIKMLREKAGYKSRAVEDAQRGRRGEGVQSRIGWASR